MRSVRSLISRATRAEPRLSKAASREDETAGSAPWPPGSPIPGSAGSAGRLAADPPLTLFLMLEAEADTGGRSLGALGSVIMGETIAGALPRKTATPSSGAARAAVFRDRPPASMAEVIRFLQRHYRFAEGARAAPVGRRRPRAGVPSPLPEAIPCSTSRTFAKPLIPRIEVADYIEMGRHRRPVGDRAGKPAAERRRAQGAARRHRRRPRPDQDRRVRAERRSTTWSCACRRRR